jgi:hypothetical protein
MTFHVFRAVETPVIVGDALDDLDLKYARGFLVCMEGIGKAVIRLQVFGGHDDDLAGESVAQRIEGGFLFTGFGFWGRWILGRSRD